MLQVFLSCFCDGAASFVIAFEVAFAWRVALRERFVIERGQVKSRYGTLGLLRSSDVPEIQTILVHGPGKSPYAYGAKGVGELCTIPTAPAIGNALYRRDGILRNRLPMKVNP